MIKQLSCYHCTGCFALSTEQITLAANVKCQPFQYMINCTITNIIYLLFVKKAVDIVQSCTHGAEKILSNRPQEIVQVYSSHYTCKFYSY